MKKLIFLIVTLFAISANAQLGVGGNVLDNTADCTGSGSQFHVWGFNSPGHDMHFWVHDYTDTVFDINTLGAIDTILDLPAGYYDVVATYTDSIGNIMPGYDAQAFGIYLDCFPEFECSNQSVSTNGDVYWFVDSVFVGISNTLDLSNYIDSVILIQAYTIYDSTFVYAGMIGPLYGSGFTVTPDFCLSANGMVEAFTNLGWGTSSTTYLWSTGDTTSSIIGLSSGTYSVVIDNGEGCTEEWIAVVSDTCNITSVVEYAPHDDFIMYPNPAFDQLQISSKDMIEEATILNALGQVVKIVLVGNQPIETSVSDLAPGQYFVRIKANEMFMTQRLVIK